MLLIPLLLQQQALSCVLPFLLVILFFFLTNKAVGTMWGVTASPSVVICSRTLFHFFAAMKLSGDFVFFSSFWWTFILLLGRWQWPRQGHRRGSWMTGLDVWVWDEQHILGLASLMSTLVYNMIHSFLDSQKPRCDALQVVIHVEVHHGKQHFEVAFQLRNCHLLISWSCWQLSSIMTGSFWGAVTADSVFILEGQMRTPKLPVNSNPAIKVP